MGSAIETHVELTAVSVALAAAIGVALGLLAARAGSVLAFLVVQLANLGRIVPSLAILALALPLVGVGFTPSVIALVAVGVPPILVNTYAGLRSVDPAALEAARGMGMSGLQVLRRVQVPLALPLVVAGASTAAVQIVSTATLAALIGGGGLGEVVFNGIATIRNEIILAGVLPIAALALVVEGLFRLVSRYATPRGLRFV
jgi:osmoprotectant transport system permease protein